GPAPITTAFREWGGMVDLLQVVHKRLSLGECGAEHHHVDVDGDDHIPDRGGDPSEQESGQEPVQGANDTAPRRDRVADEVLPEERERRAHQLASLGNQENGRAPNGQGAERADGDTEGSLVQRREGLEEQRIRGTRSAPERRRTFGPRGRLHRFSSLYRSPPSGRVPVKVLALALTTTFTRVERTAKRSGNNASRLW